MRVFRVKNPKTNFFCACCRAPRALRYHRILSLRNLLQVTIVSAFLVWSLFSFLEWKSLPVFFIVWGIFECSRKMLYRRELPCPYCGFDATWYRRDVRVARKQVETFLRDNPDSPLFRAVSPSGNHEQTHR
jgi:hypothetical protein